MFNNFYLRIKFYVDMCNECNLFPLNSLNLLIRKRKVNYLERVLKIQREYYHQFNIILFCVITASTIYPDIIEVL